jgi:hypothetical protein
MSDVAPLGDDDRAENPADRGPHSTGADDAAFDALVARFHGPSAPLAGSDRLPETPETTAATGDWDGLPGPTDPADPADGARSAPAGGWDDLVADLEQRQAAQEQTEQEQVAAQDRYVPPAPPPLPRSDALGTASWIGAIGAPVLWMVLSLFGWPLESWQLLLLVGVFLGSFGVLVSRMRQGNQEDDPDDNGAVV